MSEKIKIEFEVDLLDVTVYAIFLSMQPQSPVPKFDEALIQGIRTGCYNYLKEHPEIVAQSPDLAKQFEKLAPDPGPEYN